MDFDDIQFTEWQIDKIRVALNKYRVAHARNGRLISWTQVREDITGSDVNIDRYFEDDAELAFKPETLRRFAAEINVLELDRLKDVTRFLLRSGILKQDTLDENESDLRDFMAVHEYLGIDGEDPQKIISSLKRKYTVSKISKDNSEKTITLRLIPDPSLKFVRVEEVASFKYGSGVDSEAAGKGLVNGTRSTRKGYGFPVTGLNLLHIFLNGVVPDDRITYVQTGEPCESAPGDGIFLMRNGEKNGRGSLPRHLYFREPSSFDNVYLFRPAIAEQSS